MLAHLLRIRIWMWRAVYICVFHTQPVGRFHSTTASFNVICVPYEFGRQSAQAAPKSLNEHIIYTQSVRSIHLANTLHRRERQRTSDGKKKQSRMQCHDVMANMIYQVVYLLHKFSLHLFRVVCEIGA